MASTSTNKQPLLIDRVLHSIVATDRAFNDGMDVSGINSAAPLVDATNNDGAIIEDIYVISRGSASKVNLYISTASDFLRPKQAAFVGTITASATPGDVVRWEEAPKTLTPVPQVGTATYNRAFYLPRGTALWTAREDNAEITTGPLVGAQGGFY